MGDMNLISRWKKKVEDQNRQLKALRESSVDRLKRSYGLSMSPGNKIFASAEKPPRNIYIYIYIYIGGRDIEMMEEYVNTSSDEELLNMNKIGDKRHSLGNVQRAEVQGGRGRSMSKGETAPRAEATRISREELSNPIAQNSTPGTVDEWAKGIFEICDKKSSKSIYIYIYYI